MDSRINSANFSSTEPVDLVRPIEQLIALLPRDIVSNIFLDGLILNHGTADSFLSYIADFMRINRKFRLAVINAMANNMEVRSIISAIFPQYSIDGAIETAISKKNLFSLSVLLMLPHPDDHLPNATRLKKLINRGNCEVVSLVVENPSLYNAFTLSELIACISQSNMKNKHQIFSIILRSNAYTVDNYDLLQMATIVSDVSDFFSLVLSKVDQSKLTYQQLFQCYCLGIEINADRFVILSNEHFFFALNKNPKLFRIFDVVSPAMATRLQSMSLRDIYTLFARLCRNRRSTNAQLSAFEKKIIAPKEKIAIEANEKTPEEFLKLIGDAFSRTNNDFPQRKLTQLLDRESYALAIIGSSHLFNRLDAKKYNLLLVSCAKFGSVQKFVMENRNLFILGEHERNVIRRAAAHDPFLMKKLAEVLPDQAAKIQQEATKIQPGMFFSEGRDSKYSSNPWQDEYDYRFKIVVVGDQGVGKSCLILRFADDTYTENHIATIGVDFKVRNINVSGKTIRLLIYDTRGHQYRNDYRGALNGAHIVMACFDKTDVSSFHNMENWLQEADRFSCESSPRFLIGTKSDEAVKINESAIEAFADAFNMPYFSTSAKENLGIDEAFIEATRMVLDSMQIRIENNNNESAEEQTHGKGKCQLM